MPRKPKEKDTSLLDHAVGKHSAALASWIIGGAILILICAVLFLLPNPTHPQRVIIRFLISLCAGFMAYFFVGRVLLRGTSRGVSFSATGGFGLFVLLQFVYDPFSAAPAVADSLPNLVRTSEEIRVVQQSLSKLGFYSGDVTGIRNSDTVNAIIAFQRAEGITEDGFAGPETTKRLSIKTPEGGAANIEVDETGFFRYVDGWDEDHLIQVELPELKGLKGFPVSGRVRFHRDAAGALRSAFKEIGESDLTGDLLTWDGAYVPRMQRGSSYRPNVHAFGIAFDVNAEWNPRGKKTSEGDQGSLHRVAVVMKKHGFIWGGDFSTPDGMHFQWQPTKPL